MTPDDEGVFHGEILTPDFIEWMWASDLIMNFEDFARQFGREKTRELLHTIAQEHGDVRTVS